MFPEIIDRYVDKFDRVESTILIKLNMYIFAFVLLAHTPLIIFGLSDSEGFGPPPRLTFISVPLAFFGLLFALFKLKDRTAHDSVLDLSL